MRLYEFAKKSVLTNVGIVDKHKHAKPDGTLSPLGTNNEKPIPLTANAAVKVDNAVKLAKLKKSQ
jgi:hypothetical protein